MAVAAMKRERWDDAGRWRPGRKNIGSFERWCSTVAGGLLTAYALKRRQTPGGMAALAGAAMLYRGATGHCDVYAALGIDRSQPRPRVAADRDSNTRQRLSGDRGILVEESITINRPVSEVYRFWRNFENLPRFMRHLTEVSVREAGISHWVAKGPAGISVEWDARIINEVENKLIGWQSLEGSMVATAGSVHFDESDRGTRVRVRMQYDPPAGKLGAAVAWLFGEEPGMQVREDLRRLKQLLETGEVATTEGQPSARRKDAEFWTAHLQDEERRR